MSEVIVNKKILAIIGLSIYLVGYLQQEVTAQELDFSALQPWDIGEIQQTFIVSSIADSGAGTLREAILRANAAAGADKIVFVSENDLYNEPRTIHLDSPLPVITDHLLIDGFIKEMLWKASGVTLSGNDQHRVFEVKENVKVRIESLSIANGQAIQGGGILNKGEAVIQGVSLISNNAVVDGGAIYNSGRLYVVNSTLANNSAGNSGAGLFNAAGAVITNATFAWNSADLGGALYNQSYIQVNNSILAASENTVDCVSLVSFDSPDNRNIIQSQTGCGASYSSDNPRLSSLSYYNGPTKTIAINGNSPAINRGSNDAAVDPQGDSLIWDQRGNGDPRFAAGITDIGSFESQPRMVMEVDTLDDTDKRWCTRALNDCSLRGALLIASNSRRLSTVTFDKTVFNAPLTLEITHSLPEIVNPVTLDASDVPSITLNVATEEDAISLISDKLNLKNIVISRQK